VGTSFQLSNSQGKLFGRQKQRTLAFVLAIFFSIGLIFSDYHYRYLNVVRGAVSLVVAPIQYVVDYPVRVIGWFQTVLSSRNALIDENMRLRYQQTILAAELQKLLALKEENSQLKVLLQTSSNANNTKAMASQILAVDTNHARQLLVIDKGRRDGVIEGQPVLDSEGVMGQTIDVGYMTSTVMLISDAKCAIPVRDNRTGERAILVGLNSVGHLSLINLPKTSNVKVGDLLVTSGLGRLYPEGYPVGIVTKVENIPGDEFYHVEVEPKALLNRTRLVLLIWPDKEQNLLTSQINERFSVIGKTS